tara:strand:- start:1665 stop:2588 length:924 start_codon:yes stop_codon:yes gene_type:complete
MSKKFMKNFSKAITLSSSILISSLIANKVNALEVYECPESGSTNATEAYIRNLDSSDTSYGTCQATPDKFELTMYEMGLCTSDPISGSAGSKVWDKSTCVTTMINSSGVTVDLAPGSSSSKTAALPSSEARPPSGTYTHAFVLLSNVFGLRGSYTFSNGTRYYSTPGVDQQDNTPYGLPVEGNAAAQDHTDIVDQVGPDPYPMEMSPVAFPESQGGGKVSALLLKDCDHISNQCTGTSPKAASAAEAKRIFAVFETNAGVPVVITNNTTGLEIELSVTNAGYTLGVSEGEGVTYFGSAPFRPKFTTF